MKSLGLLVLRLVLGGIFVVHGYPKLFGGTSKGEQVSESAKQALGPGFVDQMEQGGIDNVTGFMGALGMPNAKAAAWAISLVEFLGGIAVIFGFKTRPMALALAFSQAVAINKVHASEGFVGGYEYNIALIGGTTALAIAGSGKIALDR